MLIFHAGSSSSSRSSSVNNSEVFASIPTGVAGLKENVIKERKQHVQLVTMSSSWPVQEELIF